MKRSLILGVILLLCASRSHADPDSLRPVHRMAAAFHMTQRADPSPDMTVGVGYGVELSTSNTTFAHSAGLEFRDGDRSMLLGYSDVIYDAGRSRLGVDHGFLSAGLGLGSSWLERQDGELTADIRATAGFAIKSGIRSEVVPSLIYRMSAIRPFENAEVHHFVGLQLKVTHVSVGDIPSDKQ